jgi:hypothetical protein
VLSHLAFDAMLNRQPLEELTRQEKVTRQKLQKYNDVTCYKSLSQNHHHRRPVSCCISDWSIQMASSVFYKFSSRKDESRVTFDGTGISVFDLKREIILANNMGKANDFDLHIFDATSKQGKYS